MVSDSRENAGLVLCHAGCGHHTVDLLLYSGALPLCVASIELYPANATLNPCKKRAMILP